MTHNLLGIQLLGFSHPTIAVSQTHIPANRRDRKAFHEHGFSNSKQIYAFPENGIP